jgi:hypothetical protein
MRYCVLCYLNLLRCGLRMNERALAELLLKACLPAKAEMVIQIPSTDI